MIIKQYFLLGTLALTAAFNATARPLDKEAGLSFSISVQAGMINSTSAFNTDDSNAKSDGTTNGKSVSTLIVYPLMRLQYTTEDLNTQFFVGNSASQVATANFQYELGVIHNFQDVGKFTIAASPKLSIFNETWKDPYAVNVVRETTKEETAGVRVEMVNLFNSPFGVKYAYAFNDVKDEEAGTAQGKQDLLVRKGQFHQFQLEMMMPVAEGIYLRPTLEYLIRDAEGEANSFDKYGAQISMMSFQGRHTFILTAEGATKKFSIENPIFTKKQDSTIFGVLAIYAYSEPFNWENASVSLSGGASKENSKIDFYDEANTFVSVGFGYKF